jgi:hypothetical protein
MKILRYVFLLLFLCAAAYSQTQDLGQGVFYNDEGAIVMAVDASLASLRLNSPYVMFMVFMAAKGDQSISVNREDVVMVYQGKEYKMPSVIELRQKYGDERKDLDIYLRLGKESIVLTNMSTYTFTWDYDFFPALGVRGPLATDEGSMSRNYGFRTKFYFKNPGFKKGDQILLKVRDRKDPTLTGEVAAILK